MSLTANRFAQKIAVVSGAGSGIGRAVARRLAAEGAHVIAADIDAEAAMRIGRELAPPSEACQLDVTDPESWRRLASRTRAAIGVDVLVNAAGILKAIDPELGELTDFHRVVNVNVTGTMLGCQTLAPKMRARGGGAIVNMGSVSAYSGTWNLVAYDVSKGAVRSLTKELAVYYARRGDNIRCNAVHPGVVGTAMVDTFFQDNPLERDVWLKTQPNGRTGQPDEVASLIAYLASDDARFMTGGDFLIDGGGIA
jgi:3(or 17)beta-hydroxysteroid dehydrogenase